MKQIACIDCETWDDWDQFDFDAYIYCEICGDHIGIQHKEREDGGWCLPMDYVLEEVRVRDPHENYVPRDMTFREFVYER